MNYGYVIMLFFQPPILNENNLECNKKCYSFPTTNATRRVSRNCPCPSYLLYFF